jgi:acyl transferase domain-containing protein
LAIPVSAADITCAESTIGWTIGRERASKGAVDADFAGKRKLLMSVVPRVTDFTRERISREFDDLGPDVCMANIRTDLDRHNPELLDIATQWAREAEDGDRLLTAFAMFYRLLAAEALAPLEAGALRALPRVSSETREQIVARVDEIGNEEFSRVAIRNLEFANPGLLQMAHSIASQRADYARTMQGFALLHEALLRQSQSDRLRPH